MYRHVLSPTLSTSLPSSSSCMCMHIRMRVRAPMRPCMHACVRACMRVCVCGRERASFSSSPSASSASPASPTTESSGFLYLCARVFTLVCIHTGVCGCVDACVDACVCACAYVPRVCPSTHERAPYAPPRACTSICARARAYGTKSGTALPPILKIDAVFTCGRFLCRCACPHARISAYTLAGTQAGLRHCGNM